MFLLPVSEFRISLCPCIESHKTWAAATILSRSELHLGRLSHRTASGSERAHWLAHLRQWASAGGTGWRPWLLLHKCFLYRGRFWDPWKGQANRPKVTILTDSGAGKGCMPPGSPSPGRDLWPGCEKSLRRHKSTAHSYLKRNMNR